MPWGSDKTNSRINTKRRRACGMGRNTDIKIGMFPSRSIIRNRVRATEKVSITETSFTVFSYCVQSSRGEFMMRARTLCHGRRLYQYLSTILGSSRFFQVSIEILMGPECQQGQGNCLVIIGVCQQSELVDHFKFVD